MIRKLIATIKSKSRIIEKHVRLERFGAIVQLQKPRALVFVDRQYARELGLTDSNLWSGAEEAIGSKPLSAPLEAHLQITNRCDAGCKGCYTSASPKVKDEWGLEEWKAGIDTLASMGVFHLALGGGESADLPWLGDLVDHAIAKGLVPNLTTSGLSSLDRVLSLASKFGQINVSLDGLAEEYQRVRGFDGFSQADHALQEIRKRTKKVGINVVVTRHNYDSLERIFAFAKKRKLNEIELLRFKPAGRGAQKFNEMKCSDKQHRDFLANILRYSKRHRIRVRIDCSFMPMLVHHRPSKSLLAKLAVYGCTGGDFLIGAKANGQVCACSFASPHESTPKVGELEQHWNEPDAFPVFRGWEKAQEPCRSCDYHDLCRGGCKVVSSHVLGEASAPDPECPKVIDYNKNISQDSPYQ